MNNDEAFDKALSDVRSNAMENAFKHPKFTTLLEEFAELVLSLRGKHDHPPELELTQMGGIIINLLSQIYLSGVASINNIQHSHNR